jgi:hypothetical protein
VVQLWKLLIETHQPDRLESDTSFLCYVCTKTAAGDQSTKETEFSRLLCGINEHDTVTVPACRLATGSPSSVTLGCLFYSIVTGTVLI